MNWIEEKRKEDTNMHKLGRNLQKMRRGFRTLFWADSCYMQWTNEKALGKKIRKGENIREEKIKECTGSFRKNDNSN